MRALLLMLASMVLLSSCGYIIHGVPQTETYQKTSHYTYKGKSYKLRLAMKDDSPYMSVSIRDLPTQNTSSGRIALKNDMYKPAYNFASQYCSARLTRDYVAYQTTNLGTDNDGVIEVLLKCSEHLKAPFPRY